MNSSINKLWVATIVIGIIAIGGYFFPKLVNLGASGDINTVPVKFIQGLTVGNPSNGADRYTFVASGTCSLLANFSITATTTRSVDCVASEAKSGDIVFVNLARSTAMAQQYVVRASSASTTNGYISVDLLNLTGATAVPTATSGFGSSTVYQIFRPF